MEYGILIAESFIEDSDFAAYQIIGTVDSLEEAKQAANRYIVYGPEDDCLAPNRFLIHRRGRNGHYINIEVLNLD